MKRFLVIFLVAINFSGCVLTNSIDKEEYLLVREHIAIDIRPHQGKGNLPPWESGKIIKSGRLTMVTISNSCGFVDLIYRGVTLQEYFDKTHYGDEKEYQVKVIAPMGEWCGISEFANEGTYLLKVRNWNGERYLISSTPVFSDDEETPYIIYSDFFNENKLAGLSVKVDVTSKSHSCLDVDQLTPSDVRDLKQGEDVVEKDGLICFVRRVYLKDILSMH